MGGGLGMRYWWPFHPFLAAFLLMMLLPFLLAFYVLKLLVILTIALVCWRRQRAARRALDAVGNAQRVV